MSPSRPPGLASIIVPCFNSRPFTQLCLRAPSRHTRRPWELIAIDNGSTDDTAGYLAGVRDLAPVPVSIITNPENRGFPAAVNQGLRAARGESLVLLNNDAVVTDGWLDQLIALTRAPAPLGGEPKTSGAAGEEGEERRTADRDGDGGRGEDPGRRSIGLVGPMSNDAPPPQ